MRIDGGLGFHLPPPVDPRGVLCGKEHEVGVGFDAALELRHKQLAVVIQKPIQGLQNIRGSLERRNKTL